MRVRVYYRSWVARVLGVGGITLYPFIFIARDYERELLNHEFIHIEQVRRVGWLQFYAGYVASWIRLSVQLRKHAYFELPQEVEAFERQREAQHPPLITLGRHSMIEDRKRV